MAASPFNAVKLDVAVIVCIAAGVAVALDRAQAAAAVQLLAAGAIGIAGALWVTLRVRRIVKRHAALPAAEALAVQRAGADHGQD